MEIERWSKIYNDRIFNISVRHEDWWYQAFVNNKPITRADASLDSLHDILYGNGCSKEIGKSTWEEKEVNLTEDWQIINWEKIN